MRLGEALEIVHANAAHLYSKKGQFTKANNPADMEEALKIVEDFIVNNVKGYRLTKIGKEVSR